MSLQDLVDNLADRLQRSVALDDPEIRLIVASRHFGEEDDVRVQSVLKRGVSPDIRDAVLALGVARFTGPQRIGPLTEFGAHARVCIPVRCEDVLLGFLWLLDDDQLSDDDLHDAAAVADVAAVVLYHRDLVAQGRLARCSSVVRDLISPDEGARVAAEMEVLQEELAPAPEAVQVSVLQPVDAHWAADPAGAAALRRIARRVHNIGPDGARLCHVHAGELIVLHAHRERHPPHGWVANAIRRLGGEMAGYRNDRRVVGIGGPCGRLQDAHQSYAQASVAARAARVFTGLGDIVEWEALGAYAVLAGIPRDKLDLATRCAPLDRLANSPNASTLIHTAEVFLDSAGSAQRAAAALHVHRATLYQRLARIEQVAHIEFDNGSDRLTLHLGIKLARLTDTLPRPDIRP